MATTGAVIARIISQYSDKGSKAAQKDIAKLGKNIDKFGKRATKAFGLASTAALGLAAKIGKDAIQAAMEDQKQQTALAVALRNTTGATEAAIKANSAFLDSLELQVAIDNNELMPALQRLATATGNLSAAQDLLKLSTDVAAASGKDLETVSTALARAVAGNYGPLNKLGLRLDQSAIKAKDFQAVLEQLRDISKGQAAAAANTFAGRMTILRLRFNQVVESLGYALLPTMEKFVKRIDEEIIPAIQRWVNANQKDIVKSLETLISLAEGFMKAIINIGQVMKDFEPVLKIFGSGILAIISYLKITGALIAFRTQLLLLLTVFKGARNDLFGFGKAALVATDEMSGLTKILYKLKGLDKFLSALFGISAGKGLMAVARGLGWIGVGITVAYGAYKGLDWLLEKSKQADVKRKAAQEAAMKKYTDAVVQGYDQIALAVTRTKNAEYNRQRILDGFKDIEKATKAAQDAAADAARDAAYWAAQDKERAAEEAKRLRIKQLEAGIAKKLAVFNRNLLTDEKKMAVQLAAIKKQNAKLDKAGIKLTDPDEMNAIQMEAIYQNLLKGGKVLLAEITKQQAAADELKTKAAEEYNKLLLRQRDILQALAGDNKVTSEEVGLLAKQWNMSAEAAQSYVEEILAVGDQKIDDTEVRNLALMWYGNTGESATNAVRKYLDFLNEVNKGNGAISTEGIKRLALTWYGGGDDAEKAARKYEEAVIAISDGTIDKSEIEALRDAWNVSEQAVVDYLLEVGKPFKLTDDAKTILDAATIAKVALAWDAAYLALKRYLDLAKGAGGFQGGNNGTFVPGSGEDPAVIKKAEEAAKAAAAAAADADAILAESEAALAAAEAALASATALGSIRTATGTQEINDAVAFATLVGESATDIANAMYSGLLGQGIDSASAASSARYTGMAIAAEQKRQAQALADAAARARAFDAGSIKRDDYLDMRTGFSGLESGTLSNISSGTINNAKGLSGGNLIAGGGINVTVNVAGSVTAEQDLVDSIRNGLLSTQYNGNPINLQAV